MTYLDRLICIAWPLSAQKGSALSTENSLSHLLQLTFSQTSPERARLAALGPSPYSNAMLNSNTNDGQPPGAEDAPPRWTSPLRAVTAPLLASRSMDLAVGGQLGQPPPTAAGRRLGSSARASRPDGPDGHFGSPLSQHTAEAGAGVEMGVGSGAGAGRHEAWGSAALGDTAPAAQYPWKGQGQLHGQAPGGQGAALESLGMLLDGRGAAAAGGAGSDASGAASALGSRALWSSMVQAVSACAASLCQRLAASCFEVRGRSVHLWFASLDGVTHWAGCWPLAAEPCGDL